MPFTIQEIDNCGSTGIKLICIRVSGKAAELRIALARGVSWFKHDGHWWAPYHDLAPIFIRGARLTEGWQGPAWTTVRLLADWFNSFFNAVVKIAGARRRTSRMIC